ncbi:MAG: monovalent cation:proton antiporter-2 (CPA2) family protein, partial [Rickettsiales bacterium]|nr:monovalent cation:proton antiporter-2 (CPA2) family protein [Rickettsiales bacterium]
MHSANLEEIIILLLTAVAVVAFFKRLNLSPVLGYLVAGGIIGPFGLHIIPDIAAATHIAEFGVVFLMFYIRLELSFERFKAMRSQVFVFGTLQFVITGAIIGYLSYKILNEVAPAIIIGAGLALSSTAIVLQSLAERGEQATQVGRLALAVLILQDLAVVPLFILIPLVAAGESNIISALLDASLKSFLALVIIVILGRLFLRPFFRIIGDLRNEELFTATTLLIVLAAAWQTGEAGLSMAFGAFLAGLLVAETEFRHQVESDIRPFKSLLLGLFFMTVGMQLDIKLLTGQLADIVGMTVLLMALKASILLLLCKLFRMKTGAAMNTGLLLSQGSEFAFVLFALASELGLFDQTLTQLLLVSVTLSMALTPLLAMVGRWLTIHYDRIFSSEDLTDKDTSGVAQETIDLEGHVIVGGFGRVGRTVCELLAAEKVNYIALDINPRKVKIGRKNGYAVYYGNA